MPAVFSGSTVTFQRIVERMTKELTDTLHDDHSSRRRRGTLVRGGKKKRKERNLNIVGVGVPSPLHEERVITRARRRVFTPSSTSETSPTERCQLVTSCKAFRRWSNLLRNPRAQCSLSLDWVLAHLHGGRRPRCVVAGFLERGPAAGAHAPSCSVIECDRRSERRLSSTEVHSTFTTDGKSGGCFAHFRVRKECAQRFPTAPKHLQRRRFCLI